MESKWEWVADLDSLEEAKKYILSGNLFAPDGTALTFKWRRPNPGNGTRVAYFVCSLHDNCAYQAKAHKCLPAFCVSVSADVEHSTVLATRARKNSPMTKAGMEWLRGMLDCGVRPAAVHSSLTTKELDRCKALKVTAEKRVKGGLKGLCSIVAQQ